MRLLHDILASLIPQLLPQTIRATMTLHIAFLRVVIFNSTVVMGTTGATVIVMINVSVEALPPPPQQVINKG